MKSNFLVLFLLFSFFGFSQKADPPMVVQQTMMAKYQGAKKVKWQQEDENLWEAEFLWEGIRYEVTYDNDGNRVETERQLKDDEIPEKFFTALDKEYPGYKIDEAWWIETLDGIFYEFELKGKDGEVEVLMNSNCVVIPNDDDDDENDD
jgi:uncharacterized membrane protein YkoI